MDVVVFGSINLDLVFGTHRLPAPGETVMGDDLKRFAGGKGANQAVAAARMGAEVAMVGAVGEDADGDWLLQGLAGDGIDVSMIRTLDCSTGAAGIIVDENGRNQIVVSPGANTKPWSNEFPDFGYPKVVLTQFEVDLESTFEFLRESRRRACQFSILNPAPAMTLPDHDSVHANVIIPNETEAAFLTGEDDLTAAARVLENCGFEHVIITLGSEGALYRGEVYSAPTVRAIDTTAAGDVLCGALAAFLAEGEEMEEAIRLAIRAASLSVTRAGAQASIPYRNELT